MKHLKTTGKILGLTLVLAILWSAGLSIANRISGVELAQPSDPGYALLMLLLASLLLSLIMYWFAVNIDFPKKTKFVVLLIAHYALQFALPQMETWFYLDQMIISAQLITNILTSGLVVTAIYVLMLTLITSPPSPSSNGPYLVIRWYWPVAIGVVLYPLIYFLFGYFVAWQFEAVRLYYSDEIELESFLTVMSRNLTNGVFLFQVLRGVIWAYLGWLLFKSMSRAKLNTKVLIMGGLFAIVMNAQLLLPNSVMPDLVRLAHALETATSNFIWGMVLSLFFERFAMRNKTEIKV